MSPRRQTVAVVGLAGLVCLAILGLVRLVIPGDWERARPTTYGPPAGEVGSTITQAPIPTLPDSPAGSESPSRLLAGGRHLVTGEHGTPIAGAEISWTTLGEGPDAWIPGWPWPDWAKWRSVTQFARTSDAGSFAINPPPGADRAPSVMWVTHPGHAPRCEYVQAGGELKSLPTQLILIAAPVLEARAVDAAGRPVAGARFLQRLALNDRMRSEFEESQLRGAYALVRETTADREGKVVLADLGNRQVIDAAEGDLVSESWFGTPPGQVEFSLLPRFTWTGRVVVDDPNLTLEGVRIDAYSASGGHARLIDSAPVRSTGEFGPRSAPAAPCDSLKFEMTGGAVVSATIVRPGPSKSAHLDLTFRARRGLIFPVLVTDRDGTPVKAAEVSWAWNAGEVWQWVSRFTDATGKAVLDAAPKGAIWLVVEKRGFISSKVELELWDEVAPHYPVTLDVGATLRGVVSSDGKPVPNFSIVHRRASGYADTTTADFQDRKDGTFELAGMPPGERSVFAVGDDLPRSAEQLAVFDPAKVTELNFVLAEGGFGRGVVVDARSGEPISGARVQNWITEGRVRIRPFGSVALSGAAGEFEISGLAISEANTLEVSAEGYAPGFLIVRGRGEGVQDLGAVSLDRPHVLTVRLLLPAGEDPAAWTAFVHGSNPPPPLSFTSSGEVRFEGLVAGGYDVEVARGTERAESQWVLVLPESDAEATFDLSTGAGFEVEIVSNRNASDIRDCFLQVRSGSDGWGQGMIRTLPIPEGLVVKIDQVAGEHVEIAVVSKSGAQLCSRRVRAADVEGQRVALELTPAVRTLRIVDRRGLPRSDITVGIGTPATGWRHTLSTDSKGEVMVEGVWDEAVEVSLQEPPSGGGIVRGVSLREETTELTFDPRAALSVRLQDGVEPLAGVAIWLQDGFGLGRGFETLVTDAEGIAQNDGFLAQEFRGEVRHPGLWPTQVRLRASDPATPVVLQVRRRGSALLEARRWGLAAAGVTLRIESEEFSTPVDPWIADGRVASGSAGLITDSEGRLRLDGLPRGPYRWTVTLDDGTQVGGRFEVLPQRRVDVDVLIP